MNREEAIERTILEIESFILAYTPARHAAEKLYDAGYRLVPELKALSDEELRKAIDNEDIYHVCSSHS